MSIVEYTAISSMGLEHTAPPPCERMRARWSRLSVDFAKLPQLDPQSHRVPHERANEKKLVRDVGELLLLGHDDALADAERYVVEGHTRRTGQLVDYDDID